MNLSVPIITIDGPSGAGKGTVCCLVARALGFSLLDSGALYRLTALAAMNQGVDLSSESAVEEIARKLDVSFDLNESQGSVLTMLSGENVTSSIRQEAVGMNASVVAAYPTVRTALLARQREFAKAPGLVADGRDMGTVVFPQAKVKFFLTASAEERAKRRLLQLRESGKEADINDILEDIQSRDERDSTRATAPLRPAEDALVIDSTALSIQQVVNMVLDNFHHKVTGIC